ncbi:hypothetical protein [Mariniradius sediminis]|uniref:Lipoprotein n=1 Tax=Mariniradius sediminis TaxID=2909237 RepID=A0ABS9BZ70_9BACT|nr:hypothetical protein [Mariniradius sediminis]MCF1753273.1 hypothetical protein [Mariniradius sediminis]
MIRKIFMLTRSLFVLSIFTCLSCKNEFKEAVKLRVTFIQPFTTVMLPVDCRSIDRMLDYSKRKQIVDQTFLKTFENELENLKEKRVYQPIDVRIKILIDYADNTDTLCLGEFFGVVYNGRSFEDDSRLLDLVKSKIYEE